MLFVDVKNYFGKGTKIMQACFQLRFFLSLRIPNS